MSRRILPVSEWPLFGVFPYGTWRDESYRQISHLDLPLPDENVELLRPVPITLAKLANTWLRLIDGQIIRALPAAVAAPPLPTFRVAPRFYRFNAGCYIFQINEALTERYLSAQIAELPADARRFRGLVLIQIPLRPANINISNVAWEELISINLITLVETESPPELPSSEMFVFKLIPDTYQSMENAYWQRRVDLPRLLRDEFPINRQFAEIVTILLKETFPDRRPRDLQTMFVKAVRSGAVLARILQIDYRHWVLSHPARHFNNLQLRRYAGIMASINYDHAQMRAAIDALDTFMILYPQNNDEENLQELIALNNAIGDISTRAIVLSLLRFDYGIDIQIQ